jgi:hypothetical protein
MVALATNAVLFQIGWFFCVLERGEGATFAAALILITHIMLFRQWKQDLLLALAALTVGLVQENLLFLSGVLATGSGEPAVPLWLVLLWFLMGLTLNHSMSFVMHNPIRAALAGLIFAPLSYLAGERFGAIHIAEGGVFVLAGCWAVALLFLQWFRDVLIQREGRGNEAS